ARIHLENALRSLGDENSDVRATLLLRSGIVAMCSRRLNDALRLYETAAPLLEGSQDYAFKGAFHNEFGLVLKTMALPENREDYLDRALIEYAAASFHFERAGNTRYQASVENNLGFLFLNLGRFSDTHSHLNRARKLFRELDDIGTVAQVDET